MINKNHDRLVRFAMEIISLQFDVGVCDDDVEVIGRKHQLLVNRTMYGPCREGCMCYDCYSIEEFEAGVVKCNRVSNWLQEEYDDLE